MKKLTSFQTYGRLEKGAVIFDNRRYFDGMLKFFEDCKSVRIIIERVRGGKTQAQLGYLYGHLYEVMSGSTGMTIAELDRAMKAKFLKDKVIWRSVEYVSPRSKGELMSDEMGEFIDNVYNECVELGLTVELPDKEWRVKRDFPE